MKLTRLICLVLLAYLLLSCAPALADDVPLIEYYISDAGLTLPVPATYDVITLDMSPSDPAPARHGLTYQEAIDFLTANGAIIGALSEDAQLYYIVSGGETEELASYSEAKLNDLAASVTVPDGMILKSCDVFTYNGVPYIRVTSQEGVGLRVPFVVEYFTAHDGLFVDLVFTTTQGYLDFSTNWMLGQIMQGIVYDADR